MPTLSLRPGFWHTKCSLRDGRSKIDTARRENRGTQVFMMEGRKESYGPMGVVEPEYGISCIYQKIEGINSFCRDFMMRPEINRNFPFFLVI